MDAAVGAVRQHQRQRAGPEGLGQSCREGIEAGDAVGHGAIGDMGDQRVEARPALGLENTRHGDAVGGIASQAVNRLGRDGDDVAGLKQRQSPLKRLANRHYLSQICHHS